MKALFIGGTGTISAAISRRFLDEGGDLYLLNRGNRNHLFSSEIKEIVCDINNDGEVVQRLWGMEFDVVADFITFVPNQIERDYRLFKGRTKQYLCFSSASAYQKPLLNYRITESTPLANPYWEYAQNKIACEEVLMRLYREHHFPITIVRPSHTYDERSVPVGVHGKHGSWQVLKRMREGKPVIIHGDGTSLWTVTHNSDFARGFTGLLGNPHAIGEAVQITSDETLTWNQIYQTIAHALGVELKAIHIASEFLAQTGAYNFVGGLLGDKSHSVVFDNSKLKRLVPEFRTHVRFDQGVAKAVRNLLENPDLQKEDAEFDTWCDMMIAAQERVMAEVRSAQGAQTLS